MGQETFASSVASYFIMLTMLGIPTYGIRACARVRDDREKLSQTVQELMIVNGVMALACCALLVLATLVIGRFREIRYLLWIAGTGILLNAVGVSWFYSALEEYAYITAASLCFKALSIAVMFLFVRSPEHVGRYVVVVLLASYGSYVVNFLRLRKYISFRRCKKYSFLPHIKVSLVFFAMAVATTVYTNLDVVMLGFMKNDEAVGYYNTAVRVKAILVNLVTSLGTVLLPRLSYYVEKGSRREFVSVLEKAVRFVLFSAVPLTVFFILCARETVLVLAGDQFLPSIRPMQYIMPTVLFIGLSNILGIQIMVPTGQEKKVTLSVAVGGAVDLLLNALLIPPLGAAGAALGTLAAELAVLITQAVLCRKLLRELPRVSCWKTAAATAAAAAAVWSVKHFVPVEAVLVRLLLEIAVFGAVYILAGLAMQEPFLREEIASGLKMLTGTLKQGRDPDENR
ncbi:MAG: polysaccharide biosynthesis C-terminal domain-containing protein [Oscillospiraceae bacterium]|nr:polysaccharide biosynthesis C-terminal domain-containing protein [Oscillospiraceae bacterium]